SARTRAPTTSAPSRWPATTRSAASCSAASTTPTDCNQPLHASAAARGLVTAPVKRAAENRPIARARSLLKGTGKEGHMKVAALILGILGGLATAGLGAKWVSDFEKNKEMVASLAKLSGALGGSGGDVAEAVHAVEKLRTAGYVMMVLGLIALAASGLVFKRSREVGFALLAAAIVPAVIAPSSLLAGFLL